MLFVVTAVFNFTFRPVLNGTPKDLRPVESDKRFLDAVCSIGKVSPLRRDPTHRQSITVSQLQPGLFAVCADSGASWQMLFRVLR